MNILVRIWRRLTFPWLTQLYLMNRHLMNELRLVWHWFFSSHEVTNMTYNLKPTNVDYLASLVAHITEQPFNLIRAYINEIESDQDLREHVRSLTAEQRYRANDPEARYGRRVGRLVCLRPSHETRCYHRDRHRQGAWLMCVDRCPNAQPS